jgi:hypothetical protein
MSTLTGTPTIRASAALLERLGLAPEGPAAPPWSVSRWFNHDGAPLQPQALHGRVVVLHSFQMLCRGCVHHGLPQAQRLAGVFDAADVAVLGLHTVFEHHEAMGPVSLAAFLHENRIAFPVGVDAAGAAGDPIPQTMRRYGLHGTPSLVLIDRAGRVRRIGFGAEDDMVISAAVTALLYE